MGRGLPRRGEVTERWQVSVIDMGGANWWVGVADVGGPQLRGMGPPGALPGVTDRGRRAEELPVESQGLTTRPVPVATVAAMKAVVQRVTRASVTGQSGGAGAGPGRSSL